MAQKTVDYWKSRLEAQAKDKALKQFDKQTDKILRKKYKELSSDLYEMMKKELEIIRPEESISHTFNYSKYYEMREQINNRLKKMGEEEEKVLSDTMKKVYRNSQYIVDKSNGWKNLPVAKDKDIMQVVNSTWCPDGVKMNWSQRLWHHQNDLAERLSSGLLQTIEAGVPLETLKENLKPFLNKQTKQSYSQVSRLARTEYTHVATSATFKRYEEAGVTQYRFLASPDEATCTECNSLDNEVFDISAKVVGSNAPPIHPNCRCSTCAVFTTTQLKLEDINTED